MSFMPDALPRTAAFNAGICFTIAILLCCQNLAKADQVQIAIEPGWSNVAISVDLGTHNNAASLWATAESQGLELRVIARFQSNAWKVFDGSNGIGDFVLEPNAAIFVYAARAGSLTLTGDTPCASAPTASPTPSPEPSPGVSPTSTPTPTPTTFPQDPHAPLTDEFSDAVSLGDWSRLYQVEQWGADQLETWDIGASRSGWMTMMPRACTWYQDYRAVLAFKEVTGDFVVTTSMTASNRAGTGAPASNYSLGGLFIRAPRPGLTPATWTTGGENYCFLSLGSANTSGVFQYEDKTTINSNSNLRVTNAPGGAVEFRVARLGPAIIELRREPGGSWQVHQRFRRTDFPVVMQVGLACYSDYSRASQLSPIQQNQTVITDGNPDLIVEFDYVRYSTPYVPQALQGRDLASPSEVSDAELLGFLGN